MIPRNIACLSGVVGGVCWVARYFLDAGDDTGLGQVLRWGGAMWLIIALVVLGMGVVRLGNTAIRVIIAIALPTLLWAILSTAESGGAQPINAEAIAGGVAIGVFGGLLLARRDEDVA